MTKAANKTPEVHPLAGLPEGHVDNNGEVIVYERDENGEVVGWHKEAK